MLIKNNSLLTILLTFGLVITLYVTVTWAALCRSTADPNIITFDGVKYQFHRQGDHYILYDDFKDTRVTVGYYPCGGSATCNCAVYLKKGRKTIFIDFCTASSVSSPTSQFYGVSVEKNSIGPLAIKKVPRCQIILVNQENDERVWRNITTFLGNFKCARLQGSNYYDTYVIRTVEDYFEDSVKVRIQISNRNMPDVYVQASSSSYKNTGGLCGMWDGNPSKELYVLDKDGVEQYVGLSNLALVGEFWKLHSRYNKDSMRKRCPECFLMSERSFYCPCDDFNLFDNENYNILPPNRTSYCKIPMSYCIEKNYNQLFGPDPTAPPTPTTTLEPPVTLPPITFDEATQICSDAFLNHIAIGPVINAGIYNASLAIEICGHDIINSGNTTVVELHIQMIIDQIIQIILEKPENYVDDPLFNQVLIGLCPNQCTGEGICVLASECINNTSEECLSPIKCRCNEPFGGPDCSIDLTEIAELNLEFNCCDLRNEKCDIINGFGNPFSIRETIYVKVDLIEYDSNNNERVIQDFFTTNAVTESNLLIQINKIKQLQLYKAINGTASNISLRSSEAFVNIYISYTNSSYNQFSSFVLYDSKCRSCLDNTNTLLNQNVCEINGICYNDGETLLTDTQYVCDSELNNSTWSYKPTPDPLCSGDYEWTEWFNYDTPDGDGDLELLNIFNAGCGDQSKLDEVVTVHDGLSYSEAGQVVHLNRSCFGFICLNKEQKNNESCFDYKIRQCCPLAPITHQPSEPELTTAIPDDLTDVYSSTIIFTDQPFEPEVTTAIPVDLTEGLTEFWAFDGSLDNSVSNNHLFNCKNASLAKDRFGTSGSALRLRNGYCQVPDGEYFDGDFTTMAWARPLSVESGLGKVIFDFGVKDKLDYVLFLLQYGDSNKPSRPGLQIFNFNQFKNLVSNTVLTVGEWHHIAGVHKEGYSYIYINGSLTDSAQTYGPRKVLRNNNFIGRHCERPEGPYTDADIDELKIFKRALELEEIQAEMNQQYNIPTETSSIIETSPETTNILDEQTTDLYIGTDFTDLETNDTTTEITNENEETSITSIVTNSETTNESFTNEEETSITSIVINSETTNESFTNEEETSITSKLPLEMETTISNEDLSTLIPINYNGLINSWNFDNNLKDLITGNFLFNCKENSFDYDRYGNPNSALRLNNGYCQVPDGEYFNGDFTITTYAKAYSASNGKAILNFGVKADQITDDVFFLLHYGDSNKPRRPAIQIYNENSAKYLISKTSLDLNEWYHIAAVHHKAGISYLYINGSLTDSAQTLTPRQVSRDNNFIGRHRQTPDGPYFDGVLDELKIFNRALNEEEIFNEMISGK